MRIITDHFFTMGKRHVSGCIPCQDYAHSGMLINGIHYAGVADGCSQSEDSDLGARMLLHWFRVQLRKNECIAPFGDDVFGLNDREKLTCNFKKEMLPLLLRLGNGQALDATLNFAFMHRAMDQGYIFMQGDGSILTRYRNGETRISSVEWDESMPPYLSYHLDETRLKQYVGYTREKKLTGRYKIHRPNSDMITVSAIMPSDLAVTSPGLIWTFPIHSMDFVAVFTDGIGTCSGKSLSQAAMDFANITNFSSGFVKRACNRTLRAYKEGGHEPLDDFSMAVLKIDHDAKETSDQGRLVQVESGSYAE